MTAFARHTLVLLAAALLAAAPPGATAVDTARYPEIEAFIAELVRAHGFSEEELKNLFARVRLREEVLTTIERPKEALPWYEYRRLFLTEEHVRGGVQFWARNEAALERARTQYGVAPEIVVAILGVETRYGKNKGAWPVLDTLTTLWLNHPPRTGFFRQELAQYLLLCREDGLDPATLRGSYAGAIGMAQFLPSSYRRYAVDFDGDGRRDLAGTAADAIGSIANYLNRHGWQPDGPMSDEARLEGTLYFWIERLGARPALTVGGLMRYGVIPLRELDPGTRAALIVLEGEDGPTAWLGYNNFYVITRYNRSKLYAMAVHELGETIRKARAPVP